MWGIPSRYTASQLLTLPGADLLPLLDPRDVSTALEALAPLENAAIEAVEAPFLIFRLGGSLFGVPALAVREIHGLPMLSPLPETAPFVIGVLNLRGAFVPVMDLGARIGVGRRFKSATTSSCFITKAPTSRSS